MDARTVLRAARLASVAGLVIGCGTDTVGGTTTRTPGDPKDAGNQKDGDDPKDVRVGTECAFTACGGDLLGSWTIQRACPASVLVQDCPAVTLDPQNVTVSGSFTFGSDGMLMFDITSTGTWEGVVPSSCVTGTDCPSIAATLFQMNAPPAVCTSDGDGGCACSSPATPTQTGSRSYLVNGTTAASMSFCVQGDELKLRNEAGTVFVSTRSTSP